MAITAWLRHRELSVQPSPRWLPRLLLAALLATAAFVFCLFLFPLTGFEHAFPIDDASLGIRQTGDGRHLRQVFVLPHDVYVGADRKIKVMQYHFFLADWDHDLRFQSTETAPLAPPSEN